MHSTNLREKETLGDVDALKAAAWADRALGSKLVRLHDAMDGSIFRQTLEDLIEHVQRRTGLERIPARLVAEKALMHYLDPICPACCGRKFELIPETPILSDNRCAACHGTGQRPLQAPADLVEFVKDCRQALVEIAARSRRRMGVLLR